MSRIKRGVITKRRHKRLLKQTKGFWGQRGNVFKRANETLMRAMRFAYIGRKLKKREFRGLFIMRINAACRLSNLNYAKFMHGLKKADVVLNRKMLSQMAIVDPAAFAQLAKLVTPAAK
ncbi:MAG: 50S ribosomal protein L20 [Candidatus Babeliales bacterium]|jgi:large subunit ribosomal protein L20